MADQTCSECGTTYDPDTTTVPTPVPDFTCAECGTFFTQSEIDALPDQYKPPS